MKLFLPNIPGIAFDVYHYRECLSLKINITPFTIHQKTIIGDNMNEEYERNMKKTQKIDKILKNEKFNQFEICDGIFASDRYTTYKEDGMPKMCTISLENDGEINVLLNQDDGVFIDNIQASEYVIIDNTWIPRDEIANITFSYEDEDVKDGDREESEINKIIDKELRDEGFKGGDGTHPHIYTNERIPYSCTVMLYRCDNIKINFNYDESVIIDNSKENFLRIHNTWIPKESFLMLYFDYEDEDE